MEAIGTVVLDPEAGTQQRAATGQGHRRPPDAAPPAAASPARAIEDGPGAGAVSAAQLLTEAELLREAELQFQAIQPKPEDAAHGKPADPTDEVEQTRLANLAREVEHQRQGELAYQAEQARLAAEAAREAPALPISVFL